MTSKYQIIYWRDIPAQVKARSGSGRFSREFSTRFQEAIDVAAMVSGAAGTDEYLSAWRTSEWEPVEGDVEQALEEIVTKLEHEYTEDRLTALKRAGGHAATE